jgi:hypothetical protein
MPREYETCGTEQNWEAVCSLQNHIIRCMHSLLVSGHVVYLHFFLIPTNATAHPIEENGHDNKTLHCIAIHIHEKVQQDAPLSH